MSVKHYLPCLLTVSLLTAGACTSGDAPGPASTPANAPSSTPQEGGYTWVHRLLASGGSLYIGTVAEITPKPGRPYTEYGTRYVEERGELKFTVERTVFGESISELHTRYVYSWLDDEGANVASSDWGGNVWDEHPPKRGLRLAVAVYGKNDQGYDGGDRVEGKVAMVWAAPKDDPFLQELTEACGLLTARQPRERIKLVKRLGGSKFETIRLFVQAAVFGDKNPGVPDLAVNAPELAAAPPELVLAYMRAAAPAIKESERAGATSCIGGWFSMKEHVHDAPEELRSAFEDWFLADLEAREGQRMRSVCALGDLCRMCRDLGGPETIRLFKGAGREGLIKRIEECAKSPLSRVRERAEILLDLLTEK